MFIAGVKGSGASQPMPPDEKAQQITQSLQAIQYVKTAISDDYNNQMTQEITQLDDTTSENISSQTAPIISKGNSDYSAAVSSNISSCTNAVETANDSISEGIQSVISMAQSTWGNLSTSQKAEYSNNEDVYVANQLKTAYQNDDFPIVNPMNVVSPIEILGNINWNNIQTDSQIAANTTGPANNNAAEITESLRSGQSDQESQITDKFSGLQNTLTSKIKELEEATKNAFASSDTNQVIDQISGDLTTLASKSNVSIDDIDTAIQNITSLYQ